GERGERALARWRATARAAAKQSRRSFVPAVGEPPTTPQGCALVCRGTPGAGAALGLPAQARTPPAAVPAPALGDLLLVGGPAGGRRWGGAAGGGLPGGGRPASRAPGARPPRPGPPSLPPPPAGVAALAVLSVRAGRWT